MSDQAVRSEALNIKQSFIVQAPAGSGKTTLLISRFICLLAVVDEPEEVLAITFTRKATAEMRKRIIEALNPETNESFPQAIVNDAVEKVRKRSEKHGWNLLEQPSRLQIMTIDALCTSLIRRMPWASRFGSLPGMAEDASRHYASAVLNLYESAGNDQHLGRALAKLLNHLDNNSDRLQELIVQLLQKRDQWLRYLVGASFLADDRKQVEDFWQALITRQLNKTQNMMPTLAREKLGLNNMDNSQPDSLVTWKSLANDMLTKGGTWKIRLNKDLLSVGIEVADLKDAIECCRENSELRKQMIAIRDKFPYSAKYSDRQWEVLEACSVVLQHAVAELKLEFRKHGQVDFIEIAQQAVRALGDSDEPTDLSMVLDYQYSHIMVDEFQDTSVSQRDLLERLIAGWQSDDGRTIFLVGDPMQSIYRFREAEVGIYLSVIEQGLGNLSIKPLNLTQNFRSNSKLVSWFNAVFQPSFPVNAELETGSVPYVKCTSTKNSSKDSAVQIVLQNSKTISEENIKSQPLVEKESDLLIKDIKQFRKKNQGSDVRAAILVRTRGHAKQLIPRLVSEGIKFYAQDIVSLDQRPVVDDLLSLTRALLNLADRTSWLAVLRAPWCGLTLADLLIIARKRDAMIWDRIKDSNVESELSAEGQRRISRLRDVMNRTFSGRGRLDMRDWIHDCWILLGGPACYRSKDVENAQILLDLIERYSKGTSVEGLNQFEEELKHLYAVPEESADDTWLHISTIHGAKGLEYDAVFLPRFNAVQGGLQTRPLLVWSEFLRADTGSQILMSPVVPTGSDTSEEMFAFLQKWDKDREAIELLRLAYVACTRAKEKLYMYAFGKLEFHEQPMLSDGAFSESSLIAKLVPGLVASNFNCVTPIHYDSPDSVFPGRIPDDDSIEEVTFELTRLPSNWEPPAPPAPVNTAGYELESPDYLEAIDFDWAGSVALWIGNVVHEWLEKIVRTGVSTWTRTKVSAERNKWEIRLRAMGMADDPRLLDEALARIETALNNVLADPRGQWILSDEHQESGAELRLTGYSNGQFSNVILDRTFVDEDGTRWIIDYKSGTTAGNVEAFLEQEVERYREQLTQYKTVVSGMDSRPIRTAIYFPMFPAWREVQ